MDKYSIVITPRPSHPCELRLCAYLVSPTGCQTQLRGFNDVYSDCERTMRTILKIDWPGIPISYNNDFYVRGVDPVPETQLLKRK